MQKGKTLLEFPVMWSGWECDSKGWVVEYEGENHLIVTNHGGYQFGDAEFLDEKVGEYLEAVQKTTQALAMIRDA